MKTFDGRRQKSSPIYKHFANEHDAATPNLCAFVTSSNRNTKFDCLIK